ncbi:MAG: PHB depolymerase family esterase [Sphingomonadaceae bacterium]
MPLIVMMHGCTQSAADFAAGSGMNALADELGFIVLYPEQASSANLARCWNWHRPENQKRGRGEPAAIADLTRHAIATVRANPTRVRVHACATAPA